MTKNRWQAKKNQGLCFSCGKPALEGRAMCAEHLEKRRQYAADRRKSKLCGNCGESLSTESVGGLCLSCWNKKRSRTNQLIKEKKARGECITCTQQANPEKVQCEKCRIKSINLTANRKLIRRENNLCEDCGGVNPGIDSGLCGICYVKCLSVKVFGSVKMTNDLLSLLEKQNFVCPYTKIKLELGHNASLDHIIPRSKGGKNELENLQWVYLGRDIDVNRIKMDMMEDEFKEAIRRLAESLFGIMIHKHI